jgi:uncharacterized RDD family membrane protein YckC
MTDPIRVIEDYVRQVDAFLSGTREARSLVRAELTGHLAEAAEAGELQLALERLGNPRNAAAEFNRESGLPLARMPERLVAAAIDNLPLLLVTIGLALEPILGGVARTTLAFPPLAYIEFSLPSFSGCVALVPVNCGVYEPGWLYALGLPLALLWSIVGLGIIESRNATTPGKQLLDLRVSDRDGLRITPKAGIVRRLSFLMGPLAWLDWLPVLKGEQRRILEHVAGTRVVKCAVGPAGPGARAYRHSAQ